jgi:tetratricopeptide (TPR) repeat protein
MDMLRFHFLIALLLATALGGPSAATEGLPAANERLATNLARSGVQLLRESPWITLDMLRTATVLVEQATRANPDDPELWRFLVAIARLGENEELLLRALEGLSRTDPYDDTARLARLNAVLDRHQTAEERIAATEALLAKGPDRLGLAVASRLLLDLALLERRTGDIDAFARHLSEAIEVDPSNRAAAALAAGFFRLHIDDPVGDGELLATLMLADPTDISTQVAFAERLLAAGAYAGAARVYDLAVRNHDRAKLLATGELLADQALAQWASGDARAALRTILARQRLADERLHDAIRRDSPEIDPLERSKNYAPLSPTLATVRAAIHVQGGHEDAERSFTQAMQAYIAAIDMGRREERPDLVTELALEMAWVALWIGGDVDQARETLEAAETVRPLTDEARARFEGWMALCGDDLDAARALLEPLVETDVAARLGLAELELKQGRSKTAARLFLDVAREQPGSVIGIWSSSRVAAIIEQRVPLSKSAAALEELVQSIPPVFFEYPRASSLAVRVDLEFAKPVFEAGEPIILNVEVTNASPFPLAIDADGPIRPHVVVFLSTTLQRPGSRVQEVPPIVVDIGRRLRLEPGERIVVPVDLRLHKLGGALAQNPITGVFVSARATFNPHSTEVGAIIPSLLGAELSTPTIRIEGVALTGEWIQEAYEHARTTPPDDPAVLEDLAMLARVVALGLSDSAPVAQQRMFATAAKLLETRYAEMDEMAQAWFLGTVAAGRLPAGVLATARQSESEFVQLSYLVFQLTGIEDPMIDAARRSPNESVRIVAEEYAKTFERLAEVLGSRRMAPPDAGDEP